MKLLTLLANPQFLTGPALKTHFIATADSARNVCGGKSAAHEGRRDWMAVMVTVTQDLGMLHRPSRFGICKILIGAVSLLYASIAVEDSLNIFVV
ncbi:hypothetical protein J6590_012335 [Homalodisca vitripennis]|nr:hypothetical protein J6590_012335 [Homalodisca vitripennis]